MFWSTKRETQDRAKVRVCNGGFFVHCWWNSARNILNSKTDFSHKLNTPQAAGLNRSGKWMKTGLFLCWTFCSGRFVAWLTWLTALVCRCVTAWFGVPWTPQNSSTLVRNSSLSGRVTKFEAVKHGNDADIRRRQSFLFSYINASHCLINFHY